MPILIAMAMLFFLPESLTFLVKREGAQAKVRRIIGHIAPAFLKEKDVSSAQRGEASGRAAEASFPGRAGRARLYFCGPVSSSAIT